MISAGLGLCQALRCGKMPGKPIIVTVQNGEIAMRLQNKVALISGGARGRGAAEARMFAREGARVVIGDVLDAEGRQVEAEINEAGGACIFLHLDVTQESE